MRSTTTKPLRDPFFGKVIRPGEPRITFTKREQALLVRVAKLSEEWRDLWAQMHDDDPDTDESVDVAHVYIGIDAMFNWAGLDLRQAIERGT